MLTPIINEGFLRLRGTSELEQLDDHLLADIGVERHGDVFVHEGRVVSKARSWGSGNFLTLLASALGGNFARNAHA
jgi:uncharacterized protein YjiS (DUF1127 family)